MVRTSSSSSLTGARQQDFQCSEKWDLRLAASLSSNQRVNSLLTERVENIECISRCKLGDISLVYLGL